MFYTTGVILLSLLALTNRFNKRIIIVASLALLFIVSIYFEPDEGMDLFRHYEMLEMFRNNGFFKTVLINGNRMSFLPVYAIYFYIISLFNCNKLLLIITYMIIYLAQFYVLTMYIQDQCLDKKSWMIGYVLIMVTTNAYDLTGIRNFLAFSIVEVFLYLDLCRNSHKKLSLLIYVLMCFLHDSMILILFFRLFISLLDKFSIKAKKIILLLLLFNSYVLKSISNILINIPITFFNKVGEKIITYGGMNGIENFGIDMGTRIRTIMRLIILVLIVFYIFIHLNRNQRYNNDKFFLLLLTYFCVGAMFGNRVLADRYVAMGVMYSVPEMVFIIRNHCPYNGLCIRKDAIPLIILLILFFIELCFEQYRYFI